LAVAVSCFQHAVAPGGVRCPDCGRDMCMACFESAAWPWKVCQLCEPKRRQVAAAGGPAATTVEDLLCPWCGAAERGVAAQRPACSACGVELRPAAEACLELERRRAVAGEEAEASPAADEEEQQPGTGPWWQMLLFLAAMTVIPLVAWSIAAGVLGASDDYCRQAAASLERCEAFNAASTIAASAPSAALLGPGLAVLVVVASWLGARSRLLLLALFAPGLYVVLGGLVILIALQGSLVFGLVYLAFATGARIPAYLPLAVGAATLFGVLALVRAALTSLKRATGAVRGQPLDEAAAPALWARLREIADRVGAGLPRNVVVGVDEGFWVTEAPVVCSGRSLRGRTLYLSLPTCRILTHDELSAVLGHELAHFRGWDTRFSRLFYPVYRGAGISLAAIDAEAEESVVSWLTLMPAQIVLAFFWNRFSAAEEGIGRARELAADRVGAEVTSATVAATALVKLHAFDRCWRNMRGLMRGAIVRGQPLPSIGPAFAEAARRVAVPSTLAGLDRQRLPHPTDSHPPLSQRLRALGVALEDVTAAALAVAPEPSALTLCPDAECIERELTAALPEDAIL
jgi:Zn-dependent protease with chaperone function